MAGRNWKFVKKTFQAFNRSKFKDKTSVGKGDGDLAPSKVSTGTASRPEIEERDLNINAGEDADDEDEVLTSGSCDDDDDDPEEHKRGSRRKKKKGTKRPKSDSEKKSKKKKPKSRRSKAAAKRGKVSREERLARARARRKDVEDRSKKIAQEDQYIRKSLGMDEKGMCLRHPNQPITQLSHQCEEIHLCRICDSESQLGSKAPRQRKSMAAVIGQVKNMQKDRKGWRNRTQLLFWSSKQKLDFDSSDDDALAEELALSAEEWEEQMRKRLVQVVDWQQKNELKDHPIFSRYFKMMGMGIPLEAAMNACEMDGYNPRVLELDETKSLKSQLGQFDKATQESLAELVDSNPNDSDEEELELPDLVTKVRTSFQKRTSEKELEAVESLQKLMAEHVQEGDITTDDDEAEKPSSQRRSVASNAKKRKSRKSSSTTPQKRSSKNLERRASASGKKAASKGKKTKGGPKSKPGALKAKKKKKAAGAGKVPRPKSKQLQRKPSKLPKSMLMAPILEGNEEKSVELEQMQVRLESMEERLQVLKESLSEKDNEIERLKENLRQKDAIIQSLAKGQSANLLDDTLHSQARQNDELRNSEIIKPLEEEGDETMHTTVLLDTNEEAEQQQKGQQLNMDGADQSSSVVTSTEVQAHIPSTLPVPDEDGDVASDVSSASGNDKIDDIPDRDDKEEQGSAAIDDEEEGDEEEDEEEEDDHLNDGASTSEEESDWDEEMEKAAAEIETDEEPEESDHEGKSDSEGEMSANDSELETDDEEEEEIGDEVKESEIAKDAYAEAEAEPSEEQEDDNEEEQEEDGEEMDEEEEKSDSQNDELEINGTEPSKDAAAEQSNSEEAEEGDEKGEVTAGLPPHQDVDLSADDRSPDGASDGSAESYVSGSETSGELKSDQEDDEEYSLDSG